MYPVMSAATGKVHVAKPSTDYPWPVTLCGQFVSHTWPKTEPSYPPTCKTCAKLAQKENQ